MGTLLLTAGVAFLGFFVDRTSLLEVVGGYGLAFLGYALLVSFRRAEDQVPARWLAALGILLRVVLIFSFPLLSDDVYRFIWDGTLVINGINPLAELPGYYLGEGQLVAGLDQALFDLLNSPEYYTIYPPVAQAVFAGAIWVSGGSWWGAAALIQGFLVACEVGTLWLLPRLLQTLGARSQVREGEGTSTPGRRLEGLRPTAGGRGWTYRLHWYWLNPLVIVECSGNLHFEAAMVFFLLLSLWGLLNAQWVRAGLAMALSVAAKLLPLMLLPFLIKRLWGRPFWKFSLAFGLLTAILFIPLVLTGFAAGFGSSLDLYFRKFEFNASLYYLARAYGYWDVGWNQIAKFGPLLAGTAAAGILLGALLERRPRWERLPTVWLFAFCGYLLCATTVHPWYLCIPIALSALSGWRFPLVWSALITLTYASYGTVPYRENLWLVGVEYVGVIGFLVWEWKARAELSDTRSAALS